MVLRKKLPGMIPGYITVPGPCIGHDPLAGFQLQHPVAPGNFFASPYCHFKIPAQLLYGRSRTNVFMGDFTASRLLAKKPLSHVPSLLPPGTINST